MEWKSATLCTPHVWQATLIEWQELRIPSAPIRIRLKWQISQFNYCSLVSRIAVCRSSRSARPKHKKWFVFLTTYDNIIDSSWCIWNNDNSEQRILYLSTSQWPTLKSFLDIRHACAKRFRNNSPTFSVYVNRDTAMQSSPSNTWAGLIYTSRTFRIKCIYRLE